jgi:hypothetical protein
VTEELASHDGGDRKFYKGRRPNSGAAKSVSDNQNELTAVSCLFLVQFIWDLNYSRNLDQKNYRWSGVQGGITVTVVDQLLTARTYHTYNCNADPQHEARMICTSCRWTLDKPRPASVRLRVGKSPPARGDDAPLRTSAKANFNGRKYVRVVSAQIPTKNEVIKEAKRRMNE